MEKSAEHRHNQKAKMKTNHKLLLTAISAAALFTFTGSVVAQSVGDDGIAASPKLRDQLNAHRKVAAATSDASRVVAYQATSADGITASPKLRQFLAEKSAAQGTATTETYAVGYK